MLDTGSLAPSVRSELQRILASAEFDASERNRRFLEFMVEETLAGRQHRLNPHTIAAEVFHRHGHFDPDDDPIVQLESGRLRRAISGFYQRDPATPPVRITLSKGSYVPAFGG